MLGGEGDGSLADRRNAATDRGIGTGPLPRLDRVTEEWAERGADHAVFGRALPGGANLPEDLVLADHGGVETGGHREQMADRFGVVECVEVVVDVFGGESGMPAKELANVLVAAVELLGVGVDLDPVAGRQHDDLTQVIGGSEVGERLGDVVGRDRHPLKNRERGRPVVTTDGDDRHGTRTPEAKPTAQGDRAGA